MNLVIVHNVPNLIIIITITKIII